MFLRRVSSFLAKKNEPRKKTSGKTTKKQSKNALAKTKGSFFVIRQEPSTMSSILLVSIPIFIVLVLWFLLTNGESIEARIINPAILPSPLEMLNAIPSLLSPQRKLLDGIFISLFRIIQGFTIALVIAFPLGILMGTFSKINKMFSSLIIVGSYVPIPTLLPLTMAAFGIGEEQKIGFLAIASFVFLLPAFVKTIDDIDDIFLNTAYTLGTSKWQLVTKILVPIAMPKIYDSMRTGFGIGFTWIIVAEMIGAESGLGFILKQAQTRGGTDNTPIMYLVLLVIILLAFVIDAIWKYFYKQFFPYKENR